VRFGLPLLLFLATVLTTSAAHGPRFSATLLSILVAHEMGHYLAARWHGVDSSLPHFLPMPPQIFLTGTMGAVITMRTDQAKRNQLMDIGAAGPLAGFLIAVPLLIVGIQRSAVVSVSTDGPVMFFGDSILTLVLTKLFGPEIPAGSDLLASDVFLGAWCGLLVTAINLLPIGQLDGGHVLYAFAPERSARWGRRVHRVLLWAGLLGLLVQGPAMLHEILEATSGWTGVHGAAIPRAVFDATRPFAGWLSHACLVWAVLGRLTGFQHPPVRDPDTPLTPARRFFAAACLVVWVLTFMPSPVWVDGVWRTVGQGS
jgi:membrane-associated protease RseP (regulator of RpoE activity)